MIVHKKKADCKQKRRGWHNKSFVRADRVGDSSPSFSLPSAASSSETRCEDQDVGQQQQQQQQQQKEQQQKQHSKENNKKETEEGIPDKKDARVDNKGVQKDQKEKSDWNNKEDSRGKDDKKSTGSKTSSECKNEKSAGGKNCPIKTTSVEDNIDSSQKDVMEGKCENHCEEPQSENMWRVTAASTEVEGSKVDGKAEISKEEEEEQLKNPMRLELKDVGVGVDEEEKMSARARKIYLMKELFGDDSVVDEVRRDISARLSSFHLSLFPSQSSFFISFPSQSFFLKKKSSPPQS